MALLKTLSLANLERWGVDEDVGNFLEVLTNYAGARLGISVKPLETWQSRNLF